MPNWTPSITALLLGALLLATTGCASRTAQTPPQGDLRFSAHAVIEAAPVHHALHHLRAGDPDIPNGGIAALYRNMPRGDADLAGHADTQALRHSLAHPDLRIILTVTAGHYRIVTSRATGIRSVADLRGRKVATVRDSSAAFYLERALDTAGLREADVQIVPIPLPPKDAGKLLIDGAADALVLWDPEPEIALHHLGKDAVILDPDTGYQELYNLHTTAAKLADPATRAKIVRFVATLMQASREIRRPSAQTIALTAQITGYAPELIRASWPQHRFPARLSPALLDTLTTEEAWMAANDRRTPRTRETLATLIDPSVQAEAGALLRGK